MKKCLIKYELEYPETREQLLKDARFWEREWHFNYGDAEDALIADYVLSLPTHTHNETPEVIEVED